MKGPFLLVELLIVPLFPKMKIKLFKIGFLFYLARKMKRAKAFDFLLSI
jgi:hypothetical protein